jgi:hypothetical protein
MTRLVLAVVALVVFAAWLHAQSTGYRLAVGQIVATEQEQQECYFSVGPAGQGFTIVTHPQNIACVRLRELVGSTGMIYFQPDE